MCGGLRRRGAVGHRRPGRPGAGGVDRRDRRHPEGARRGPGGRGRRVEGQRRAHGGPPPGPHDRQLGGPGGGGHRDGPAPGAVGGGGRRGPRRGAVGPAGDGAGRGGDGRSRSRGSPGGGRPGVVAGRAAHRMRPDPAAAVPDPEARRRAIHRGRYLRSYTDAEGAWNLRVRDNPEVGAQVMAAVEPLRDRLFRAARSEGRRGPLEARRRRRSGWAGPGRGEAAEALGQRSGQGDRARRPPGAAAGAARRGRGVRGGRLRAGGGVGGARPARHGRPVPGRGRGQGRAGGGRGPPRAPPQCPPADRPRVAVPRVHGEGLSQRVVPRGRSPRRLGQEPRHGPGPPGPVCAPTTTTSRPGQTGPSSRGEASGSSSRPATPGIPVTPETGSGRRRCSSRDDDSRLAPTSELRARQTQGGRR